MCHGSTNDINILLLTLSGNVLALLLIASFQNLRALRRSRVLSEIIAKGLAFTSFRYLIIWEI